MRVSIAAVSRTGLVRADNEDCLLVAGWVGARDGSWSADRVLGDRSCEDGGAGWADEVREAFDDQSPTEPHLLVAVFDGMGGHQGGGIASRLAANMLGHAQIEDPDGLRDGLLAAHRTVQVVGRSWSGLAEMGTTAVAALVEPARLTIAHVGDSLAFRLMNGALGLLVDPDRVPDPTRPGATMLTQCLGVGRHPQPSLETYRILRTQRILLCSDGLSDLVSEAEIKELLAQGEPHDAAEGLVAAAYREGADDNVSVIVLDLTPDESPDGDEAAAVVNSALH